MTRELDPKGVEKAWAALPAHIRGMLSLESAITAYLDETEAGLAHEPSWDRKAQAESIVKSYGPHTTEARRIACAVLRFADATRQTDPAPASGWREALEKIIEMNVQYCIEKYGDASKAESMGCVVVARAALASAPEPPVSDGWRPIETAPKDGTMIIAYRPTADDKYVRKVGPDYWGWFEGRGSWGRSNSRHQPTLWQPLPAAPKNEQEAGI